MNNRLYRSQTDKVIAGVCGGLGHYFNIDPTLVRLLFVILAFAQGAGLLLYFLLWILLPYAEGEEIGTSKTMRASADEMRRRARSIGQDIRSAMNRPTQQTSLLAGGVLVGLGVIFLLNNLHIWWLRWLDFDVMWPLLLVAAGIAIIARRNERQPGATITPVTTEREKEPVNGDRPGGTTV